MSSNAALSIEPSRGASQVSATPEQAATVFEIFAGPAGNWHVHKEGCANEAEFPSREAAIAFLRELTGGAQSYRLVVRVGAGSARPRSPSAPRRPATAPILPDRWETKILAGIARHGPDLDYAGSAYPMLQAIERCIRRSWIDGKSHRATGSLTEAGRAALGRARAAAAGSPR